MARLGRLDREVLLVVFLDADRCYIADEVVWVGGHHLLHSRYRVLIQRALDKRAASLLLVHNHPSGDPRPSRADIAFTRAFHALTRTLEIGLCDHLVVTRSAAFSILLGKCV